jgi:PAS domain S-box-containing protein
MRSGPASILVVEDEAAVALDIRATLERLGYAVPAAVGRGRDAIERASALRPDLVLMDIHLRGDMDGVETAQHVRQVLDIPVIYLTAYADPATLQRARVTEPYGYLLKPFHERELHIVIEMALYRHEMERRLRESERWLTATLRSIGESVIATDAEWRIRFMSRAAERLTGWKADEAVEHDLAEVLRVSIPGRPRALPGGDAIANGGTADGLLLTRDGRQMAVEEVSTLIRDDGGTVIGIVIALRVFEMEAAGDRAARRKDPSSDTE